MPCDGLTFAVLIGGEEEFVGLFNKLLQFGDVSLFVARHDVIGLKAVIHVDGHAAPGLVLDLRWGVSGALRKVTNVTDGRLHHVVAAKVASNSAGLGR